MDIFSITDGALGELGVPFFDHMPEFAEGEDDRLFITYNVYDVPEVFGDGEEQAARYYVTVSVFGSSAEETDRLYNSMVGVMTDADFCRGGTSYSRSNDYPSYCRRSTDFIYDLRKDESE